MQHYLGLVPCRYIDQERRGKASFRLCALLIRIILLPSRSSILHTCICVFIFYMANGVSLFFFFVFSGIVFIIFASYVLLLLLLLSCSFPFCLFLFSWFCCFLFIGVQSTLPSIQASLLTSTSFFGCFYAPRAAIFYIDSYSSKLFFFFFCWPKLLPLLLFYSFTSVASLQIFNKKQHNK